MKVFLKFFRGMNYPKQAFPVANSFHPSQLVRSGFSSSPIRFFGKNAPSNKMNLGDADEAARLQAVENHHQWVDIAEFLGAHSIRVNAAGSGTAEEVAKNAADGLSRLGEYGASKGINIIVENHGGY